MNLENNLFSPFSTLSTNNFDKKRDSLVVDNASIE